MTSINAERLVLDASGTASLDLCSDPFTVAWLEMNPARKQLVLATAAGGDGAIPMENPTVDAVLIRGKIRVAGERDQMDDALANLRRLAQKLDEAVNVDGGMEMEVRPRGASTSTTYYVLHAEVTALPRAMSGENIGWYHGAPVAEIEMLCEPFGYGEWSTPQTLSGGAPFLSMEVQNVPGDVDAEGELTVVDESTQYFRHFDWCYECLTYDTAAPNPVLLNLASGLTVTGYAGASGSLGGRYSANSINFTAREVIQTICASTGHAYRGPKRITARVYLGTADMTTQYRAGVQMASGGVQHGEWVERVTEATGWTEIDLGVFVLDPPDVGAPEWVIFIQGRCMNEGVSGTAAIDYVGVLPVEAFAAVSAPASTPIVLSVVGADAFNQSAGNGSDKSADIGGAWDGAGDSDDFTIDTTGHRLQRGTTADAVTGRVLYLAGVDIADVQLGVTFAATLPDPPPGVSASLVARFVDINNYVRAGVFPSGTAVDRATVTVTKYIGGSATLLFSKQYVVPGMFNWPTGVRLGFQVYSDGSFTFYVGDVLCASGADSALATGGTLDSGSVGIRDYVGGGTAITRYYDDFDASSLAAPNVLCFPDKSFVVKHNGTWRYDAAGTHAARPGQERGARLLIPPAGDAGRTTRLVTGLRRDGDNAGPQPVVDDQYGLSLRYRPRYRFPVGA